MTHILDFPCFNLSIMFTTFGYYKTGFHFFFFSVRCRLVIFIVPPGWGTAPSGVGRWLFNGVCFLGNFLLARCFLFLFCGEGMTAGQRLWFVLPVRRGKGLTFQCQSCSCGYTVIAVTPLFGGKKTIRWSYLTLS